MVAVPSEELALPQRCTCRANRRKGLDTAARQNRLERRLPLRIEPGGIHALKRGQVSSQLPQRLPQLQLGSNSIALLMMIETDGKVNQRLKKEPIFAASWPPQIFQDFMTFVKLARIE